MERRGFLKGSLGGLIGGLGLGAAVTRPAEAYFDRVAKQGDAGLDLVVSLDFGGGSIGSFSMANSTDIGEFHDTDTGVRCRSYTVSDPNFPDYRVIFRVDTDSTGSRIVAPAVGWRDEVLVELGRTANGVPANRVTPYVATITKAGSTVYSGTIPLHIWGGRWNYISNSRPVIRTPATLIARGWIPNFGPNGLFGTAAYSKNIAWGGPFSAPADPTTGSLATAFEQDMQAPGDHEQIGYLTEAAADYMIRGGSAALTTLTTEARWFGNAAMHWRDDATGAMLDVRTGYKGYQAVIGGSVGGNTLNNAPAVPGSGTMPAYIYLDTAHMYPCATAAWLLTGDPTYLEELQFVANWGLLYNCSPRRTQGLPGLVDSLQTRAFAWGLRDLVVLAASTPASVPIWLQPQSYWLACVEDCRQYALKYVNATSQLIQKYRCWTRTDGVDCWMQAWLSFVAGWAAEAGMPNWGPIFTWSIDSSIQLTNGTSGWPRDWPCPYTYLPDKNWAARPFGLYTTDNTTDATVCASYAALRAYYNAGSPSSPTIASGETDSHGYTYNDTGFDGLSVKEQLQTTSLGVYVSSYIQHTRSALAMAAKRGITGAQDCYDYIQANIPAVFAYERIETGQARFSVDIPMHNALELVGTNVIRDLDPDPTNAQPYRGVDGIAGIMAYSGACFAPNLGPQGSILKFGGGDADYWGNQVYAFDIATLTWSMITTPTTTPYMNGLQYPNDPNFNAAYCEHGDGHPGAFHSYQLLNVISGGTGGKGIMVTYVSQYCYVDVIGLYSHALDLGTTPPTWSRFMGAPNGTQIDTYLQGSSATCYDAGRNRIWAVGANGIAARMPYLDLTTGIHGSVPCPPSPVALGTVQVAARVPVRGLMVYCGYVGPYLGTGVLTFLAVDLANPGLGARPINMTGDAFPTSTLGSAGFDWDTVHDVGYVYVAGTLQAPGDLTHVYMITPPSSGYFTNPWRVTKITLPGTLNSTYTSAGVNSHWMFIPTIGKFALISSVSDPVTLYTPTALYQKPFTKPVFPLA